MTAEAHHLVPLFDDYHLRKRILKLRWIGLNDEADLLAAHLKAQLMETETMPRDPRQTD